MFVLADIALDPITAALTNLGSMGVVAALLFYLLKGQLDTASAERKSMLDSAHTERKDTLQAFREELAAERKVYTESAEARHAELMARMDKLPAAGGK